MILTDMNNIPGHCRFNIPGNGSHGSALTVRNVTSSSRPRLSFTGAAPPWWCQNLRRLIRLVRALPAAQTEPRLKPRLLRQLDLKTAARRCPESLCGVTLKQARSTQQRAVIDRSSYQSTVQRLFPLLRKPACD